ncbi:MAG: hypothetical protein AAF573_17170, partial [Bacteroidota bacterium]
FLLRRHEATKFYIKKYFASLRLGGYVFFLPGRHEATKFLLKNTLCLRDLVAMFFLLRRHEATKFYIKKIFAPS